MQACIIGAQNDASVGVEECCPSTQSSKYAVYEKPLVTGVKTQDLSAKIIGLKIQHHIGSFSPEAQSSVALVSSLLCFLIDETWFIKAVFRWPSMTFQCYGR